MNNNNRKAAYYETVDIIDIEDEDHSFAAFFIGMKTGPSPYVKRPLVHYIFLDLIIADLIMLAHSLAQVVFQESIKQEFVVSLSLQCFSHHLFIEAKVIGSFNHPWWHLY